MDWQVLTILLSTINLITEPVILDSDELKDLWLTIANCTQKLLEKQQQRERENRLNLHTLLVLTRNFMQKYYLTYTKNPELWYMLSK